MDDNKKFILDIWALAREILSSGCANKGAYVIRFWEIVINLLQAKFHFY